MQIRDESPVGDNAAQEDLSVCHIGEVLEELLEGYWLRYPEIRITVVEETAAL